MHQLQDIIAWDKDDTLLTDGNPFPGVEDFLLGQREKGRLQVVATMRSGKDIEMPKSVRAHLDGVYGQYLISGSSPIYLREDGSPERIDERIDRMPHLQNRYVHPLLTGGSTWMKDLYLLRKYLSPQCLDSLRMVFVGNRGDISAAESDTKTPLIVVSNDGSWIGRPHVSQLLETFFVGKKAPAEVFDGIIAQTPPLDVSHRRNVIRQALCSVFGEQFIFEQRRAEFSATEDPVRVVYEERGLAR